MNINVTLPHPTHHLVWVKEGHYYKCSQCSSEDRDETWQNLSHPCLKVDGRQITFPISREDYEEFERECEEGDNISFQGRSFRTSTHWHDVE